eukprot:7041896-Prymnesium_polylepis.1
MWYYPWHEICSRVYARKTHSSDDGGPHQVRRRALRRAGQDQDREARAPGDHLRGARACRAGAGHARGSGAGRAAGRAGGPIVLDVSACVLVA